MRTNFRKDEDPMVSKILLVLLCLWSLTLFWSPDRSLVAGDIEHNSRCVERYNRCLEKCNVKIEFLEYRQCANDCWEDYQWCLRDD